MKDITNLDITAQSSQLVELYNTGISELCRFKDPSPRIEAMLNDDPAFVMGLILQGNLCLWTTDKDDHGGALEALTALQTLPATHFNHRERMHLAALEPWVKGDLMTASDIFDQLLVEYPQDILALLSGHQLDFFLGQVLNLRDRVGRVLPCWDQQHPLYGYLLGMLSFGQEEAGHYEQATDNGLRAVAMNPGDIWGIHAVAHAREMRGQFQDGAAFMRQYEPYWNKDNDMISHNAIHLDLFLLETGELEEAVAVYDKYVHFPGVNPAPMALLDGSSVLWRLYLENQNLGHRAQALADSWMDKHKQRFYVFNDAHAVIAHVAAGDFDTATDIVTDLKDYLVHGDSAPTNYQMVKQTGLAVCEAFLAFGQGDYKAAVNKLWPIKNSNGQFGGSLAQRDVLARTLLEAAIRDGNRSLAQALVNERLLARPASPYNLGKQETIRAMA
ncbi:tetratricopeptide repeat protein [Oceanobacter sp. 5_MG-2023]|uniref:tetratricopeptide repeat protein n=1 Tax=Oceanobacter sp. 5_MG-2023 TaxID=3062645 RepID=UPI0026E32F2C|nr:tetratricopeptide repeat protein [Oceanobacter sp. 5_MG-2023]MDO6683143.1 tetratricopeptide repeat protein [Oceanobacter sp. 5_MG-2023]